jgi:hypothetical protein
MSKFVLSTATCNQRFVFYRQGQNGGVNVVEHSILIKGGANSPSLTSGFGELTNTEDGKPLWTPQGVVTKISDADAELLEGHIGFQAAVKRGFYKIIDEDFGDSHKKVADAVGDDMTKRDGSAPLNSETLKSEVKVTTKLAKNEDD